MLDKQNHFYLSRHNYHNLAITRDINEIKTRGNRELKNRYLLCSKTVSPYRLKKLLLS